MEEDRKPPFSELLPKSTGKKLISIFGSKLLPMTMAHYRLLSCWKRGTSPLTIKPIKGNAVEIASLQIENFRGVRNGTIRFSAHTVLVGANNCGKTT